MLKKNFRKRSTINSEEQLAQWEKDGKPLPPPHIVKQKTIWEYQKSFQTDTLIETGTYLGDMIDAQRDRFQKIYSIELSEKLFKKASKRFKIYPQIKLLKGDSGEVLNELVPPLNTRALFWLDGHYSGGITAKGDKECPVPNELRAIFKSDLLHIILIDDARLFNGTQDYPTIQEINNIIRECGKDYSIEVKNDIIRLTPNFQ
jgi:hypothetical protein